MYERVELYMGICDLLMIGVMSCALHGLGQRAPAWLCSSLSGMLAAL
jgi:hypothetical protein